MAELFGARKIRAVEQQKGDPLGLATLDASARVPLQQLPSGSSGTLGVVHLSDDLYAGLSNAAATASALQVSTELLQGASDALASPPLATLTANGLVRLSDAVDSMDSTVAATANAVRETYAIANSVIGGALAVEQSANSAAVTAVQALTAAEAARATALLALDASNATALALITAEKAQQANLVATEAMVTANAALLIAEEFNASLTSFLRPWKEVETTTERDVTEVSKVIELQLPPATMNSNINAFALESLLDGEYVASDAMGSANAYAPMDGISSYSNPTGHWVTETGQFSSTSPFDTVSSYTTLTSTGTAVAGPWLQLKFPVPMQLSRVAGAALRPGNAGSQVTFPALIDIYISNTGLEGSWTYAVSVIGGSWDGAATFPANVPACLYVRAICRRAQTGVTRTHIGEMYYYGWPAHVSKSTTGIRKMTPQFALDLGGGASADFVRIEDAVRQTVETNTPALSVAPDMNLQDNGSSVFRIRNGNVGVGNSNPTAKLHVSGGRFELGTGLFMVRQQHETGSAIYVNGTTTILDGRVANLPRAIIGNDGRFYTGTSDIGITSSINSSRWAIQQGSTLDCLVVNVAGSGTPLIVGKSGATGQLAIFQGTGNVSISSTTITPTAKLDVDGDVVVRGRLKNELRMVLPLSRDYVTSLTAANGVLSYPLPAGITLTKVPRITLGTASSSGLVTVDIKVNGTSIFGATKLSIDAAEKTSATAAAVPTLASTAFAEGAELTVDLLQAGTDAKGLVLTLFYKLT